MTKATHALMLLVVTVFLTSSLQTDVLAPFHRIIPYCVINDLNAPAPTQTLTHLQLGLKPFSVKFGLEFQLSNNGWAASTQKFWRGQAGELQAVCPNSEIIFVLTDKVNGKINDGILGFAEPPTGIVFLYAASYQLEEETEIKTSLLTETTTHEVAHMFGAQHEDSDESLMYPDDEDGGQWTKATENTIIINRNKTWLKPKSIENKTGHERAAGFFICGFL